MSKKSTKEVHHAQESGPRDPGKNTKPNHHQGAHATAKHPETRFAGEGGQRKQAGGHDSGKTHHENTTKRDENKPEATPAKQLFAEVK